jgi:DNA invertase Pin-like site-specific DNA recombinase
MLIGYARVSTDDQKLDLQLDALKAAGICEGAIYQEYVSGVATKRPQLAECLRALRKGDVLVIWKLDRLGRSLAELIKISKELEEREIGLRSLTDQIDTTTAGGRLIFHVFGAVAQFERDIISERTKAGLRAARARGHRGGRKTKISPEKLKAAKVLLSDPRVTHVEVAKSLGVSRPALYRAMKHDEELRQASLLNVQTRKAAAKMEHV